LANDTVTKFKCHSTPVILYNSNVVEFPFFVLTIESPGHPNSHTFPVTEELLGVRCENDKNGKELLLVNHVCGGNGCAESNHALIELSTGKEVLKASETMLGNVSRAESILGKPLIPFSCKEWSKSSSKPNDRGEFCLVSPIELY
jgi:hypothetical protein